MSDEVKGLTDKCRKEGREEMEVKGWMKKRSRGEGMNGQM